MLDWKKALTISTILLVTLFLLVSLFFSNTERNHAPLKVLVIFQEDEAKILLEKFKQSTGQTYEIIRMSSGEASYHLLTMNQTEIDVILGGPADLHEQLKNSHKLLKYSPKHSDTIPDVYKDPEKYWTGMYMGPLAIGINTEIWAKDDELSGMDYPTTFDELLKPEYAGKFDLPNPETSGTGYTILASLAQQRGEAEAIELMKGLTSQSASATFSGIASAQRLAMGEVTIAISFLGDQLRYKNSGYSIHSIIPAHAGWEIGAVSIMKNTSNKKVAKQLVDFVLDQEAQTFYMNTAFSFPASENIEANSLLNVVELENTFKDYSFALAASRRQHLLELWNK